MKKFLVLPPAVDTHHAPWVRRTAQGLLIGGSAAMVAHAEACKPAEQLTSLTLYACPQNLPARHDEHPPERYEFSTATGSTEAALETILFQPGTFKA